MPTLSLLYLDLAEHENPWSWPTAEWISPADVDAPADAATGAHSYDDARTRAYADVARRVLELERLNHAAGARYIAGSATDVWGTMPGISLHTELELLTRIGLSPREALAAATTNTARTFGFEGVGTIEPGGRADLVIVDADPTLALEALRNPYLVIAAGRLVRR
jgi:imidazolonepropionase-like amidohydrolase